MNCRDVMERYYEYDGDQPMPLLLQIRISAHLFFCSECAGEIERYEEGRDFLRAKIPLSPAFEDVVMARIEAETEGEDAVFEEDGFIPAAGIPLIGWIITGIVVFFSLSTLFLGLDFNKVAATGGISFLLPMGITIGVVLTIYGAIFIGSHLKELSERFGLH
jgi:hypothetical protein